MENGQSVELRVNDRGPFADDRIIGGSVLSADCPLTTDDIHDEKTWLPEGMGNYRIVTVDPAVFRVRIEARAEEMLEERREENRLWHRIPTRAKMILEDGAGI